MGFEQVSLLTNGVRISDKLIQILEKNKDRVYVQIDLHSLNEEYFSWFTKTPNVLEKVKYNIVVLANKGILMRIATILTPKNKTLGISKEELHCMLDALCEEE